MPYHLGEDCGEDKQISIPVFYVDFNELIEPDLVFLSKNDHCSHINNNIVLLQEDMRIMVIENDFDENGQPDNLVASGVVERNLTTGWAKAVKWCCRVDSSGVQHQSDISVR